jgi:hypothetical protein
MHGTSTKARALLPPQAIYQQHKTHSSLLTKDFQSWWEHKAMVNFQPTNNHTEFNCMLPSQSTSDNIISNILYVGVVLTVVNVSLYCLCPGQVPCLPNPVLPLIINIKGWHKCTLSVWKLSFSIQHMSEISTYLSQRTAMVLQHITSLWENTIYIYISLQVASELLLVLGDCAYFNQNCCCWQWLCYSEILWSVLKTW